VIKPAANLWIFLAVLLGLAIALATTTFLPQSALSAANSALRSTAQQAATQQSTAQSGTRQGLNIVVLDPGHGGTDLGARGTEGIRESEVVLEFAAEVKKQLEQQGLQVIQTRDGNDNPSFDDRSARANAQHGAVFITLHLASTGTAGTARVYVTPEIVAAKDPPGLLSWDHAQAPYVAQSHKLGDLVQVELARRFKGSPTAAIVAPVRQLRTTAAPAIAVEISSVSVKERQILDRMVPGVAEAIARGVAEFRPWYTQVSLGGGTRP
jgi:N-acetylmuramoyl-L-alanine amidase